LKRFVPEKEGEKEGKRTRRHGYVPVGGRGGFGYYKPPKEEKKKKKKRKKKKKEGTGVDSAIPCLAEQGRGARPFSEVGEEEKGGREPDARLTTVLCRRRGGGRGGFGSVLGREEKKGEGKREKKASRFPARPRRASRACRVERGGEGGEGGESSAIPLDVAYPAGCRNEKGKEEGPRGVLPLNLVRRG